MQTTFELNLTLIVQLLKDNSPKLIRWPGKYCILCSKIKQRKEGIHDCADRYSINIHRCTNTQVKRYRHARASTTRASTQSNNIARLHANHINFGSTSMLQSLIQKLSLSLLSFCPQWIILCTNVSYRTSESHNKQ